MNQPSRDDRILALLRDLPGSDMDPLRAGALRELVRATVARRQLRRVQWLDRLAVLYDRVLEPVLAAGLALGFLAWVVARCVEAFRNGPRLFF